MSRKDEPRFADLIGEVRRLEHDRIEPPRRPRVARPAKPAGDAQAADTWQDANESATLTPREDHHRPGVQRGLLRKLKRGQFPVVDELDLHGLRLSEARAELHAFLSAASRRQLCCVRVIHGKGFSSPGLKPVLKPNVRHWLSQDERVLAYAAIQDSGGGSGAVNVLLRARRD